MEEYRQLIKGENKDKWITSFANELGRLTNGVGTCIKTGTNTIEFIPYSQTTEGGDTLHLPHMQGRQDKYA
eukprot:8950237-Ditylum_brightwellii.AAC.1